MTRIMAACVLSLVVLIGIGSRESAAIDTTIKCTCTCKDSVGTFKQSCYSTSSCDTCCGYSGDAAVIRARQNGAVEFTESSSTPRKVMPVAAKEAPVRRDLERRTR